MISEPDFFLFPENFQEDFQLIIWQNLICQQQAYQMKDLKENFSFIFQAILILNKTQNLKIQPLTYFSLQNGFLNGGAGAAIESKYLSINAVVLGDNGKNMNIQTGFSFQNRQNQYLLQLSF